MWSSTWAATSCTVSMSRPRPTTVRSTMVSMPAALSSCSRSTACATCVARSHPVGQLDATSGERTKTCSCMSVVPRSAASTAPRTVLTCPMCPSSASLPTAEPAVPYRWRRSAGLVGPGPFHGDAQQDAPLLLHGGPVLTPVGVLARDLAVVGDEAVYGLGQRHHLHGPLHLDRIPVEVVGEDDQRSPGPTPEVLRLDRRLAGGDDDGVVVDAGRDQRQLRVPVGPGGGQDGPVILGDEVECGDDVHSAAGYCTGPAHAEGHR